MMIIEMRDAAFEKAFELLDEAKLYGKKEKMVLCALEDAIYDCYNASKDEDEWSEEDSYEDREEFEFPSSADEEMNYRSMHSNRRGYRNMRHYEDSDYRRGMRRNMRRSMR